MAPSDAVAIDATGRVALNGMDFGTGLLGTIIEPPAPDDGAVGGYCLDDQPEVRCYYRAYATTWAGGPWTELVIQPGAGTSTYLQVAWPSTGGTGTYMTDRLMDPNDSNSYSLVHFAVSGVADPFDSGASITTPIYGSPECVETITITRYDTAEDGIIAGTFSGYVWDWSNLRSRHLTGWFRVSKFYP